MNCRCREQFEMKPCLKDRRVIEVNANLTLWCSLRHRIYSCPDDRALGATGLILTHDESRSRVPLEVCAFVKLAPNEHAQLGALAQPFRSRLENYRAEIAETMPHILPPGVVHHFYFLSDEPWPLRLLQLTATAFNTEWAAILAICAEPERFFEWPQVGELLWSGCTLVNGNQPHRYPVDVADRLFRIGILQPDTRSNGPAIMAFRAAGGKRPTCGNQGWHIHHIYDGTDGAPHAIHDPNLFTHSAGLVAAHPVAHHLAHQSTLLKWLLRREAFLRFGFDPMNVFVGA